MAAGNVDVEGGFFQIAVTEQQLDGAQVRTRLVEMSRKTMAQRVHMHGLVEARPLSGIVTSAPDGLSIEGLRGGVPSERSCSALGVMTKKAMEAGITD